MERLSLSAILIVVATSALIACGPPKPEGIMGVSWGADAQQATEALGAPCASWTGWVGEEIARTYEDLMAVREEIADEHGADHPEVVTLDAHLDALGQALERERFGGALRLRHLELSMRERDLLAEHDESHEEVAIVRAQRAALDALAEDAAGLNLRYLDLKLQEAELKVRYAGEAHPRMTEVQAELAEMERLAGLEGPRTHRFEVCSTGPIQAYGAPALARVLREGDTFEAIELRYASCSDKRKALREAIDDGLGLDPEANKARWSSGEFILFEHRAADDVCTLTVAGKRWGSTLRDLRETLGLIEPEPEAG